jgi:arylsulfatase A-like enzyme
MTFPRNKIVYVFIILCCVIVIAFVGRILTTSKPAGRVTDIYHCTDCNVILITMTNLRYDHMSGNGYARNTTPNLDAFAKNSIAFENAFSHASWTLPEAMSIYTSLYPYEHGVMSRYDGSTLAKNTPTLVDILNAKGYKTAIFSGGYDYYPEFGLTNRFQTNETCTRDQNPSVHGQNNPDVIGPEQYGDLSCTVPKAITWLNTHANDTFFLHVQGFDAHCPFSQKPTTNFDPGYTGNVDYSGCLWTFEQTTSKIINGQPYYSVYSQNEPGKQVLLSPGDVTQLVARYDEGIYSADTSIGALLNTIRQLHLNNKTIIIFTSEHGDMFGKYGRFMRGGPLRGTFYDDVLHVPLIIQLPGVAPAKRAALTSHIDLAPTILDLLGLASIPSFEGKSLRPVLAKDADINSAVYAGSKFSPGTDNFYFTQASTVNVIRTKEWKLIQETLLDQSNKKNIVTEELYHVSADKEEMTNLAGTDPAMLNQMRQQLDAWVKRVQ